MTFSSPSRDSRGTNRKQSIKPEDYADLADVKPSHTSDRGGGSA